MTNLPWRNKKATIELMTWSRRIMTSSMLMRIKNGTCTISTSANYSRWIKSMSVKSRMTMTSLMRCWTRKSRQWKIGKRKSFNSRWIKKSRLIRSSKTMSQRREILKQRWLTSSISKRQWKNRSQGNVLMLRRMHGKISIDWKTGTNLYCSMRSSEESKRLQS